MVKFSNIITTNTTTTTKRSRKSTPKLLRIMIILWVYFVVLSTFKFEQCEGLRHTNVFRTFNARPVYSNTGHFMGFFPKRIPVPFSAPSRKHNDLGLQSWRSP
ncbi:hypothetical protein RND81_13G210300 [Saponaria officinalis]|uniref:Uncharacterized protein n=1 Tax=Saponaria officinalis TaxID=3572 RepID=A0AAW1H5Q7_SAPOF